PPLCRLDSCPTRRSSGLRPLDPRGRGQVDQVKQLETVRIEGGQVVAVPAEVPHPSAAVPVLQRHQLDRAVPALQTVTDPEPATLLRWRQQRLWSLGGAAVGGTQVLPVLDHEAVVEI